MSIKSELTKDYMKRLEAKHYAARTYHPDPFDHQVAITGMDNRDNPSSIGFQIRERLLRDGMKPDLMKEDVTDRSAMEAYPFERYSSLVMTHGLTHLQWFDKADMSILYDVVEVNLIGTMRAVQSFVNKTMHLSHRKKIVSIGSMAYKAVLNGSAAYCASKAGAAHLMKCLAFELAPKGYDVFSVHPSNVLGSPMTHQTIEELATYRHLTIEEATSYWDEGRLRPLPLTTGEIGDLVAFLLSDKSSYLSGCNLELAGGMR